MRLESVPISGRDFAISRWMSIVGKLLLLGGLASVVVGSDSSVLAGGFALLMGPLCLLGSYASRLVVPAMRGFVEVRGHDVVIGSRWLKQTIRARRVRSAYVVMRKREGVDAPAVEILTRARNLHRIFVPDVATGEALVEALGCGPRGKALRLELGRPLRRLFHPLIALGSLFLSFMVLVFTLLVADTVIGVSPGKGALGFLFFAVAAIAYELLKRGVTPPIVTIGSDGIEVTRGYSSVRVPRSEIARVGVDPEEGTIVVLRRGARSVVVRGMLLDRALLATANVEVERRLSPGERHPRAASFDRGARDVGEWKAGLRATLDAGYRDAGVTVEDACDVLVNATASAEQRIGAALALRVAGEPPERIRIAAEGTVDPKLRVAFEAIADSEDERLEKTLRRLELGPNARR